MSSGFGDGDRKAARTLEVQKMIKDGFALFDKDSKGVCDVREVGTVVRHLGICPTEIELRDMITEIEEEEPTGFIRFEKFERMMSRILLENQYPRDSEDKLLRAFRTLDPDNKGYIEADKLRNLLTTHGERFSQEEIDDFLTFASDAESGRMHKASDSKVLAAPQRTTPSLLGLTHQAPAWPGSLDGGRGAGLIA
jgi:Ca2+-binding EF-hand superfamily protein